MGVVYQAHDTKLDRTVALKFLPPELSRDKDARERLKREAQAASRLQHNNICAIHEINETPDGRFFICMAYYEGESLKQRIERGPMRADEAVRLILQIAQGLAHAHRSGIVHRDIKPANVVVTRDGVVKILDFGLARAVDQTRITRTGNTVGTVAYMSPEQVRGDAVDARSDIFSLGVMFQEMLTGTNPFRANAPVAVSYKILHEEPKPIDEFPQLGPIIRKMLAKDVSRRYADAEHVIEDLGGSVETLRATRRTLPRRRVVVATSTAILLAAAAIAFFSVQRGSTEPNVIAVVGFENLTDASDPDRLSRMLVGLITTDLTETGGIPVIATSSVMSAVKKAGGDIDGAFNGSIAPQVGELTRARTIITGQVMQQGNRITLVAELVDVGTGRAVGSIKEETDDINGIFDLAGAVADRVRRELGVEADNTRNRSFDLAQSLTASPDAYERFVLGETALHQRRFADAAAGFEAASALDSTFALAWYRQYVAYDWNGQVVEARRALQHALRHMRRLPSDWQVLIQATDDLQARPAAAYRALDPLVESGRTIPEVYNQMGELCFHGSEFIDMAKAASCFQTALDLDPFFKIVCYHLLNAHVANGDTAAADALIARIAKDDSSDPIVDGRLHYLTYRRQYRNASDELQRQWNAGRATHPYAESEALIDARMEDEALSRAANQMQRFEGRPRGGVAWGYISVLVAQGRLQDALEEGYRTVAEGDPMVRMRALNACDIAILLSWIGDTTRQIEELRKGVVADYYAPEPRAYLIHALSRSGRNSEAHAELDSLRAMQKRVPSPGTRCYVHVLQALLSGGNDALARTELAAVDARPLWERDLSFETLVRGDMLEAEGNYGAAAELYRRMLTGPRVGTHGLWAGNGTRLARSVLEIPLTFKLAALEEQLGNAQEAKRLYGEFLSRWGDAVPQIEMVKSAKERQRAL